ncbi:hypothetical protein CYMTET_37131 [Cymbomonas tetramitiformis]|uniref:Uncharacterized protein n=1 Tax=Cymbomonas tetramitiformis TaxID=36881 RepID=A0AAE0CEL2_9CHLO|nr:hypothetical protein CYMTET_37131 [Cymbomonas tetramitiformis]
MHTDVHAHSMEELLGLPRVYGEAGIRTYSALMCLDEQGYTEVLPETVETKYWPENKDGVMQLPAAFQGFPAASPFQQARVGGGPGWRSLSLCVYHACSYLEKGVIDLDNAVHIASHGFAEMYGMPIRMVCIACGDAIQFKGGYDLLPRVHACKACIHPLHEGTDLTQVGHVMCGECFDFRNARGLRPPLMVHERHVEHDATLKDFQALEPAEARARAVLNFADVAMGARQILRAFGPSADLSPEERASLRDVKWNLPPAEAPSPEQSKSSMVATDEGAAAPAAARADEHAVLLGHTPAGAPAVGGVDKPNKQHKKLFTRKRSTTGELRRKANKKRKAAERRRLTTPIRHPMFDANGYLTSELLHKLNFPSMELAKLVASVITHNWNASRPTFACRCSCHLSPSDVPGWHRNVASLQAVPPCLGRAERNTKARSAPMPATTAPPTVPSHVATSGKKKCRPRKMLAAMKCGLEGQPATSAAAPMAAPAATPAPEARVVGAAPPCPQGLTEGTLVYGNDGRASCGRL